MQHELTDAQILYAADDATEETTSSYKAVGLPYLRAFLNSLPDQPDDWQACERSELRIGDYLCCESAYGTFTSSEPIKWFRLTIQHIEIEFENGSFVEINTTNKTFYRIPAPVQRPDPEEHPYILVFGYKTHGQHITNYSYKLLEWRGMKYEGRAHALLPEQITEWRPLKVVDHDGR